MASMIAYGVYDAVLGSRILGGGTSAGERLSISTLPIAAFSKEVLTNLPLVENSDDFVFDNEMRAQCLCFGFRIGELSCPTRYFGEASSINCARSVKYGFGVLGTTLKCGMQRAGIAHFRVFSPAGRKLLMEYYLSSQTREMEERGRKA